MGIFKEVAMRALGALAGCLFLAAVSFCATNNRSSASPGTLIGTTTYDMQHMSSMGRQTAFRTDIVHFVWTSQTDSNWLGDRRIRYQAYDANTDTYLKPMGGVLATAEYSGNASCDALMGGQAIFACDESIGGNPSYNSVGYIDFMPGLGVWSQYSVQTAQIHNPTETIWPVLETQYGFDSVVYLLTHAGANDPAKDIILYRMNLDTRVWDGGTYIDDCENLSYTIVSQPNGGGVAIIYTDDRQGLPPGAGGQDDLDVYVRISTDQGLTWGPKTNITNYPLNSLWRAFGDVAGIYTSDGDLHVVWNARELPFPGVYSGYKCRLMHWSAMNNVPGIIAEARYDMGPQSDPGQGNLYIAKMSISECEGNLYALWTQFGDQWHLNDYSAQGYANGDLWMAASDYHGLTWDPAVNLTNTYTPGCASTECDNDNWASMTRYGMVYPGGPNNDTLDIIYINDKDAGAVPLGEGSWSENPVMYLRMPCRNIIASPQISLMPYEFSAHVPPGTQLDTSFTITNYGNAALNWSASLVYVTGSGWMSLNPAMGTVPAGYGNTMVVNLTLNTNNITVSGIVIGEVIINSDGTSPAETISVYLRIDDRSVANFRFGQYNFLDPSGAVVVSNSNWGQVSFDINPNADGEIQYMNVSAVIGTDTGRIVRNYPILPIQYLDTGRYYLDFNLDELGVHSGTKATNLSYNYIVTPTPLTSGPGGPFTPITVSGFNNRTFGGMLEEGNSVYTGPGELRPIVYQTVDKDSLLKNKGLSLDTVPSVQEGCNECGAGSTARSLKWLSNEYGYGLGTGQSIQEQLHDATLMDQGVNLMEFVEAKNKFITDNNLPLEVHYWYSTALYGAHPDWHNTPGTPSESSNAIDLLKWLYQELKRGQDVELFIRWGNTNTGHLVILVGVDVKNKEIEYRDDETQGDNGTGDIGWKSASMVPLGNGEYGYKSISNRIVAAIAESPVESWISTDDPGPARPPHPGNPPAIPKPWKPVRPPRGIPLPGEVGSKIWLGKNNLYMEKNVKYWTFTLTGNASDKYRVKSVKGYIATNPPTQVPLAALRGVTGKDGPPKQRIFTFVFKPQPDWEVVELVCTAKSAAEDSLTISSESHCNLAELSGNRLNLSNAWMGGYSDWLNITDVQIFPRNVSISPAGSHAFTAPGTWMQEFTYTDPDGNSRPQGGVRWYTPGSDDQCREFLAANDTFSLSIEMLPPTPDSVYTLYAYDRAMNEYISFDVAIVNTAYLYGDANGDQTINIGDAVFMINYIFKGGPAPVPLEAGDANCDGARNIGDAVYVVNYIFKGGPAPCCP